MNQTINWKYLEIRCVTELLIGRGLHGKNKPGHDRMRRHYRVGRGEAESTPVETGTVPRTFRVLVCERIAERFVNSVSTFDASSVAEAGSLGA